MREDNMDTNNGTSDEISELEVYRYRVSELEHKLDQLNTLVSIHRESQRHFQELAVASPVGIYKTDPHTTILYANDRFAEVTGWPIDKVIGSGWLEMLHPDDKTRLFEQLRSTGADNKPSSYEMRAIQPDGKVKWIYCQVAPQMGETGKLLGYVGTVSDITDKKLAEEALRASEKRYSSLTENSPDVIARMDREHKVVFVNKKGEKTVSKTSSEILGRSIDELGFTEGRFPEWLKTITTVFDTGMAIDTEVDFQNGIGSRIFNIRLHPEKDSKGEVATILILARDITEQRRTEENYKLLFNSMHDGFAQHEIVLDGAGEPVDYRFIAVNPAFEKLTGIDAANLIGKTAREALSDFDEAWLGAFAKVAAGGEPAKTEIYLEGIDRYFDVKAFSNRRGFFACVYHDVTERKYGEIELKIMTETLDMLDRSSEGDDAIKGILKIIKNHTHFESIAIRLKEENDYPYYDTDGFTDSHLNTEHSLCSRDQNGNQILDAHGKPILDCICGTVIEGRGDPSQPFFTQCGSFWSNHLDETGRAAIKGGLIDRGRYRCVHQGYNSMAIIPLKSRDQTIGALQLNDHRPNRFTSKKMMFFEGIGQSIGLALSKRKTDEKIKNLASEWMSTFDVMTDMVALLDADNVIMRINKATQNNLGASEDELRGSKCKDIFRRLDENIKICSIEDGNQCSSEHNEEIYSDRLNRHFHVMFYPVCDENGRVIKKVLIVRDVTERKRMDAELMKGQKLESLGVLAGGIAHDFNNILQSLWGNITLTKMEMEHGTEKYDLMDEAEKSCRRIRDLTSQLLTFARGGAPIKKTANIAELIEETAKFSARGSNVKVESSVSKELWPLEVDKVQLSQVIDNLVINAVQAMPKGGVIEVKAENMFLGDELARETGLTPGKHVAISVTDAGSGIPDDIQIRIFDPYFTTKKTGSGLGLATCYSIIARHEGKIVVKSKVGQGSTFTIYLPASSKAIEAVAAASVPKSKPKTAKILVMDDEEAIWKVSGKMLKILGYETDFASNGEEAIEKYVGASKSNKPFTGVILDLTVPGGMGGREAVRRLTEIDKNLKAIVSSGYSDDPVMANYKQYGFSGVISKPYRLEDLEETLINVLGK